MDVANIRDAYVLLDYQRCDETWATQVYSEFASLGVPEPSSRQRAKGQVAKCSFSLAVLPQLNGRQLAVPRLLLRIGGYTVLARPPGLRAAEPGLGQ